MANVGAGVFQGMPVSTSLSASSLNESAGARTPLASLITGALVLLTLLFLAPLFSDLPKPVLAAVIIDAVVFGMIDVAGAAPAVPRHAVRLLDRGRRDRRRALRRRARGRGGRHGALAGLAHLRRHHAADAVARARAGHAGVPRPRREPRRRDVPRRRRAAARQRPVLRDEPGARGPRPGADAGRVARRRAPSSSTSRASTSSTRRAPSSSRRSSSSCESSDATLRLARVKPSVLAVLRADGFVDRLGADRIHGNVQRAVEDAAAGVTRLSGRRARPRAPCGPRGWRHGPPRRPPAGSGPAIAACPPAPTRPAPASATSGRRG